MRILATLFLVVLCGCRSDRGDVLVDDTLVSSDPDLVELPTVVSGDDWEGVLFDESRAAQARFIAGASEVRSWQPTIADVRAFEERLRSELMRAQREPATVDAFATVESRRAFLEREIGEILVRLPNYHRQYVGLIDDEGRRVIAVNAFPSPAWPGGPTFDLSTRWLEEVVAVSDGGYLYWQAAFDVDTGRLVRFDSNGYA